MTIKSSKTSMTKLKENKPKTKLNKQSLLVFINKHKKKHGYPVDALEMMRRYCGRG